MLIAVIVVIGVLLLAALVLAIARRQDTQQAVGVLSRETRRRDRSGAALEPLQAEVPQPLTGREVERQAALERSGRATGTAVVVAPSTAPVLAPPPAPIDEEALGVTRRQFFNRGILTATALGVGGFGAAALAFLWPSGAGGFGGKVNIGSLDDINKAIAAKQPYYNAAAKVYIQPYPKADIPKAKKVATYVPPLLAGMEQGYVALYQKCVHLGCRVPWCQTSQWFECPCHGSKYNRVGEKRGGPAPRGLDRFALSVSGGSMLVDTSTVFQGPPIGTDTTGQGQEGAACV